VTYVRGTTTILRMENPMADIDEVEGMTDPVERVRSVAAWH
jgi:hypothetical protein